MGKKDKLNYKDLYAIKGLALIPILCSLAFPFFKNSFEQSQLTQIADLFTHFEFNSYGLFYIISTFLIVSLGFREKEYYKKFSLKRFFIRRILRLLPLYFLSLGIIYLAVPIFIDFMKFQKIESPPFWWSASFCLNYLKFSGNNSYVYALHLLWTIGLLVQYNVFTAFFTRIAPLKFASYFGLVLFVIGIFLKLIFAYSIDNAQFLPTEFLWCIGLGMWLGTLSRIKDHRVISLIKSIKLNWIKIIYISGLILIVLLQLSNTKILMQIGNILSGIFLAFIILEQLFNRRKTWKFRNLKFTGHLGKRSYGLYICIGFMVNLGLLILAMMEWEFTKTVIIVFPIVALISGYIVSLISYKFFERPILRFRRIVKRS